MIAECHPCLLQVIDISEQLSRLVARINLVVAMDRLGIIGSGGTLPWSLPADLRWFKAVTMGHPLVMGRRTHESIGRALPGRRNIVVSRSLTRAPAGIELATSFEAAVRLAGEVPEIMVIGGAELYVSALRLATRIFLTEVHAAVAGDVTFPSFERAAWRETAREFHGRDARHAYDYSFVVLERCGTAF